MSDRTPDDDQLVELLDGFERTVEVHAAARERTRTRALAAFDEAVEDAMSTPRISDGSSGPAVIDLVRASETRAARQERRSSRVVLAAAVAAILLVGGLLAIIAERGDRVRTDEEQQFADQHDQAGDPAAVAEPTTWAEWRDTAEPRDALLCTTRTLGREITERRPEPINPLPQQEQNDSLWLLSQLRPVQGIVSAEVVAAGIDGEAAAELEAAVTAFDAWQERNPVANVGPGGDFTALGESYVTARDASSFWQRDPEACWLDGDVARDVDLSFASDLAAVRCLAAETLHVALDLVAAEPTSSSLETARLAGVALGNYPTTDANAMASLLGEVESLRLASNEAIPGVAARLQRELTTRDLRLTSECRATEDT